MQRLRKVPPLYLCVLQTDFEGYESQCYQTYETYDSIFQGHTNKIAPPGMSGLSGSDLFFAGCGANVQCSL